MTRRPAGRRLPAAAGLAGVLLALAACSGDPAVSGAPAGSGDGDGSGTSAGGTGSTVTCEWAPAPDGNPYLTEVARPDRQVPATGTVELVLGTNLGEIPLLLDREGAPCAAASLAHLAEEGFLDGSPCHRQTDSEALKVLQCGDPTGTGAGGPTYVFDTEVTGEETYPRGTVAMANSGQGVDGSQFFLVWGDSTLPPDYTVVGTVAEPGLAVLDEVAAHGNDGSLDPRPGGGAPSVPVTVESATVR